MTSVRPAERVPAVEPADRTRLALLGSFGLYQDHDAVPVRPSGQRLLAYLAIQSRPVPRSTVAATLWPDTPCRRAAANLRSVLWRLPTPADQPLLACHDRALALAAGIDVDLHTIRRWAMRWREGREATTDRLPDIGRLSRDVLPDWEEDWLLLAREAFRQLRLHALEALCAAHRGSGRWEAALQAAMAAVAGEPLRESAHRAVVQVHLAEGNAAEALRHYHLYRQLLSRELGLPPSPVFRRMMAPLLGRPAD